MGPAYDEALEIWQDLGDQREIANALYNDSFRYAVSDEGRHARSRIESGFGQMTRALEIATASRRRPRPRERPVGDRQLPLLPRRRRPRPRASFDEALEIFRRVGDRTMEAWSLHMLGTRPGPDRRPGRVRAEMRGGPAPLPRASATSPGIALVLDDLASIAIARGDLPPGRHGCGVRRGRCRRQAASAWPTSSTSSTSTTPGRAPGSPSNRGARAVRRGGPGDDPRRERRASPSARSIDALGPHDHGGRLMIEPAAATPARARVRSIQGGIVMSTSHRRGRRGSRRARPDLRQLRRGDGRAQVQADLSLRLLPVLLRLLLTSGMPVGRPRRRLRR